MLVLWEHQAARDRPARGQTGGSRGSCHVLSTGVHTCPGWPVYTRTLHCFVSQSLSVLQRSVDPQSSNAVLGPFRENSRAGAGRWCELDSMLASPLQSFNLQQRLSTPPTPRQSPTPAKSVAEPFSKTSHLRDFFLHHAGIRRLSGHRLGTLGQACHLSQHPRWAIGTFSCKS